MPMASQSSESLRQYLDLMRALHLLMSTGQGDSAEADAIRDRMDEPWGHLDEVQVKRVRGLSADLYSLEADPAQPRELAALTAEDRQKLRDLSAAEERGDHDAVLQLLREVEPALEPSLVANLRGSTWHELGFPEIASLFLKWAAAVSSTSSREFV